MSCMLGKGHHQGGRVESNGSSPDERKKMLKLLIHLLFSRSQTRSTDQGPPKSSLTPVPFTRQAICLPINSLKSRRTVLWDTEVSSLYRTSAWRRGQVPPLCWSVTRPAVSRAANLRLRFQRGRTTTEFDTLHGTPAGTCHPSRDSCDG